MEDKYEQIQKKCFRECTFSAMKDIKAKHRHKSENETLHANLRIATTGIYVDTEAIVNVAHRPQMSHKH